MEGSQFLSAFDEGRSARRNGHRKSSNPYLIEPIHRHLIRTWEGGWEFEAHHEGCVISAEIESEKLLPVETPFLAHIYRFIQHSIGLDEASFLKEFQALSLNSVPDRMVQITVILPKNKKPQSP